MTCRGGLGEAMQNQSGPVDYKVLAECYDLAEGKDSLPGRGEHIYPIESLRTVHLSEHLIDNSVCHTSAIMASSNKISNHIMSRALIRQGQSSSHLFGAIESNSSKKRIQGFAADARSKRSRTLDKMSDHRYHRVWTSKETHGFLACTDIFVENFRSLDADEVETTFFSDSGR